MNNNIYQNKKVYITVLSIIASLGVVLLHTNGCFWDFSTERYWITANVIESMFYFSAPVFFMITGATLIDYRKKYNTKTFFKKRISKILLPFLFWTFAFIGLQLVLGNISLSDITVTALINGVFNTSYISVYWFFIVLVSVYVSIPVLSSIDENSRRRIFKYIIILSIILNCLLPLLFTLTNGKLKYNYALNMPIGMKYLIYPIMGYYIDKYPMSRKTRIGIYICGLLGLILILFGTMYLSLDAGKIVNTFKNYENLPCIAYSASVFLFAKQIGFNSCNKLFYKIIDFISPTTFGIYLIHMFFITILTSKGIVNAYSIYYRVFGGIAIYLVSILISKCIQKIPYIKKLIP